MGSHENRATMKLLLLICLGRILGIIEADVINSNEVLFDRNNRSLTRQDNENDNDHKMVHLIEQQMLLLNKSGDAARDKRALGILLQGFMEALGYTVTPLQVASLANAAPAAQISPMTPQSQANPMPMAPAMPNATAAAPAPPPRQRETLRFTGVLNFGNNANTSNLINHLAQYEQLFHRNGSAAPAAPPPMPAPVPKIDPRSQPPLPEPLFVKIPLPIAPELLPPEAQPPISLQDSYRDEYANGQEEVYQSSQNAGANRGEYEEEEEEEEENDKSHQSEEYGSKQLSREENYREPEDKKYEYESYEKPIEKNSEKEYKNNKKIVNYSVENKEIYDPREVFQEVPITSNKFRHTMYVNEPDWKKNHDEQLYKLVAQEEAQAEALAEENAEREKERNREHELDEGNNDFHNSREKQISDHNERQRARYEIISEAKPYYNEKSEDESGLSGKESYDRSRDEKDNDDYREEETNVSDTPPSYSRYEETTADVSKENGAETEKYQTQAYDKYSNGDNGAPPDYHEAYENAEEQKKRRENEASRYYSTLPVNYNRENSRRDHTLRDSYGESLENTNGKVDERLSSYFTMFKNPRTGIYDPNRIRDYESSRTPYDHLDLVNGFKRIQQEYGLPENKYEEYDINSEPIEHRAKSHSQGLPTKEYEREKSVNESEKSLTKVQPEIMNCDCSTRKKDGQSEEARNYGKSATTGLLPSRISEVPTNYHSKVKYHHEPVDYDQTIIARLTSYNQPITARFEDTAKYVNSPPIFATVYQQQTTARPTEATSNEKLTTEGLLQETDTKEIRAWPAPFDYAFDNSDRNDVILKATPTNNLHEALSNQPPIYATPYDTTKPNCYQAHLLPPIKLANNFQLLPGDNESKRHNIDNRNKRQRRPANSSKHRRVKNNEQQMSRKRYDSTLPPPWATAVFEEGEQTQSDTERSVNYEKRNGTPATYASVSLETHTPQPEGIYTTIIPPKERKIVRRLGSPRHTNNQQVAKLGPRKNHDNYRSVNKSESSNYVEKDGILIIPEPTPYYYDERVAELTDEPHNETGIVKVKEYRNRTASVKVSNLKQFHPVDTTRVLQFSSNL